jgi:hypothetical protein
MAFLTEYWYIYTLVDGIPGDPPGKTSSCEEEQVMGLKTKEILTARKARLENELKARLAELSGKGTASPKSEKDPLFRKLQADIKAVNKRLRAIADADKRSQDAAKAKADRAAAPKKEPEVVKPEKPKKSGEEGKAKKPKPEKKPAAPVKVDAPEGGQA